MSNYTPMIQQYLAVKAQVPDAFLFFRLGDFYEMFFDDAVNASRELEITLTGRDGGAEEKIPMCGVPYHSAETYIARLIEKGFKVAICEQVENPAEAKGVVKREIVRIVTPGTLMDGKLLPDTANNYIACAVAGETGIGFAACDISTGELHVTRLEQLVELLLDELSVFAPSECIGAEGLLESIRRGTPSTAKPPVYTIWDKPDDGIVREHFSPEDLALLEKESFAAVSRLMSYLNETQKRSLTHITHIDMYRASQYMTMDPFTRRNLELTETVRERSKKGSLLWLLDDTVTSMGGRLLRRWIEKPLLSRDRIEERLEAVDCLYNQLIVREEMRTHLRDIYDLERLTARVSYGSANARDLNALAVSLAQIPAFREACLQSGSVTLAGLVEGMDDCGDVHEWISSAIVDDPPVSVRDGGMIRDGYQERLDQLKEANRNGKRWIAELEQKERERTGVKSLKIGFNKVFGYYIEVTRANLGSLPEGLYERKQTLANAERFITPELKEKEALILEAEEKMVDIEYALFTELRERVAGQVNRLQQLADIVAQADVYQSLAAVSARNRYRKPKLTDGYSLHVEQGRHPVVETVAKGGAFIANDTAMEEEDSRMLLITGPNMAGKSTYMRQVAILSIMAQIGCFVPAESAEAPLIDRIFTRIGAADDLIGGQSTFMVEMMDIQVMCEKATRQSLVIIDELGRGTSTGEGMAIAQAVIEFLHDRVGCKTLVSTHFHELAHLEESLSHLKNYCMAVKESGEQVTFLRKLIRGAASTSYGIYCARIAGLPESIIGRAYHLLGAFEAKAAVLEAAVAASAAEVKDEAGDTGDVGDTVNAVKAGIMKPERTPAACPVCAESGTALKNKASDDPVVQLSLFGESDKLSASGRRKPDPKAEAVIEDIKAADLMNMTPLQAINFIFQLKAKLNDK